MHLRDKRELFPESTMAGTEEITIYTIGHSNHHIEGLLDLLRMHDIQTIADVRSRPFSRRNPQFNQDAVKKSLWKAGIEYVHEGESLGGHPTQDDLYDNEGHVAYERLANARDFRRGIKRIEDLATGTRLALMCAEQDPEDCHRHPLLARVWPPPAPP